MINAYIEPITGRYIHLKIQDVPYRIYYEEAGQGVPLLCLHTAGSDGRQYRALLNDEDITVCPMYLRARKGVGYLPQEPSVFRKLTVKQNVMAILETLPLTKSEQEGRASNILDELGIGHLSNQKY